MMKPIIGVAVVLLLSQLLFLLCAGATKPSVDVPNVSVLVSEKSKTVHEFVIIYGLKLGEVVSLQAPDHTMTISFEIKDPKTAKRVHPHQVFLRFYCASTNEEFILLPSKKNDAFKLVIDMNKHAQSVFDFKSGLYSVELIIGDVNFDIPMSWNLGSVSLDFSGHPTAPSVAAAAAADSQAKLWSPSPEIKHIFRAPEKRASRFLSRIFTLITLCPWIFLVVALIRVKANMKGFFADFVFSLGFQLCILALIVVLALYWLQINIFQALAWLSIVGTITFLLGIRALRGTVVAQKEKTA